MKGTHNSNDQQAASPVTVSMISLGCAKNTVDTERLIALLIKAGYLLTEDPTDSEVCLVNTCGFIRDAREETSAVLHELASQRRSGQGPRLIVALGCLVGHQDAKMAASFLNNADYRVPFSDYLKLPELLKEWTTQRRGSAGNRTSARTERRLDPAFHTLPRALIGTGFTASLKISEGCSNGCRFCAIPAIRGGHVSRPINEVLAEARDLARSGVREISIIAQDTGAYGLDFDGRPHLPELLRALRKVEFDGWFRLMYVHPDHVDDAVLDALGEDPRFCRYLDMPLQHAADEVLASMGRGAGQSALRALVERIRARLPGVALRTAFIVGYPGETEAHFEELVRFVKEMRFDHVGVFCYSPEPGTAACRLSGAVAEDVKKYRHARLMHIQRAISRKNLAGRIGETTDVLCEETRTLRGGRTAGIGRTRAQAADIDGRTLLQTAPGQAAPLPGTFVRARVISANAYDLTGMVEP